MKNCQSYKAIFLLTLLMLTGNSCVKNKFSESKGQESFLQDLKVRNFKYFWEIVDTTTWQTDDRYPTRQFTSIAATGFALSSYIVGAENKFVTRKLAAERVLKVLDWLWNSKQSDDTSKVTGYRGFYYHFLNYDTGTRFKDVELSTIDTGILLAGILSCQSYFDGNDVTENRIRSIADSLYLRVDWKWAMNGKENMSMGWTPQEGFIDATWKGYNEAMILLILALGSPTHPIDSSAWNSWCKTYVWDSYYGKPQINFSSLFGHQYSLIYIDFRKIYDKYISSKGIDYFENSRRATMSNRAYCIENPSGFIGYGEQVWGLTACDGPASREVTFNGKNVQFMEYSARGASKIHVVDDGTIAPTAAGGSIPFLPEYCISALYSMRNTYGDKLYQEYGFKDAFNLTYSSEGWFDKDYIGIDQGPILLQLENYQTELIWNTMKKNKYIIHGLKRAGFTGGWLDSIAETKR